MTKAEYADFEARFARFMAREGLNALTSTYRDGDDYFTWRPCECCGTPLAGTRERVSGYNPSTGEVYEYEVCRDCLYYAAYGQLDDMTMLDMEE